MNVYIYDKTFDGLLTAVFDAYFRKTFPDFLLSEGDALPLFYDELHTVVTDEENTSERPLTLPSPLRLISVIRMFSLFPKYGSG